MLSLYNQSVSESVNVHHVALRCWDGRISSEFLSLHTDLVSEDQSPVYSHQLHSHSTNDATSNFLIIDNRFCINRLIIDN